MKIVIVGAGVAGLAAAIASARAGHEVLVVESDGTEPPDIPQEAPRWERRGIPHFLMPHAFLARGVKVLKDHAPDLYSDLLEAGATEISLAEKIPADQRRAEDEELLFLGCRRPVIEWVLRRAAASEPGVSLRSGTDVEGLQWDTSGATPRARGVVTKTGAIAADLVIEASGRRSRLNDWIATCGGDPTGEEQSACGLVYFSRYYRFRQGRVRPEGPWLFGPRAELGYMESATFWGDNNTFSIVHTVLPSDRDLKLLRAPAAFTACVKAIPVFEQVIDDDVSEPITPVAAMGQLRNRRRHFIEGERPIVTGVIALGDALCHTNPRLAWGLSLSLLQAFVLGRLLEGEGRDVETLALEFDREVRDLVDGAFETSTSTDAAREPYWTGRMTDIHVPTEANLPLFLLYMFPMAGARDAEIFRKAVRRLTFLDPPHDIESDAETLGRARDILKGMVPSLPPAGPRREEMVSLVKQAGVS